MSRRITPAHRPLLHSLFAASLLVTPNVAGPQTGGAFHRKRTAIGSRAARTTQFGPRHQLRRLAKSLL